MGGSPFFERPPSEPAVADETNLRPTIQSMMKYFHQDLLKRGEIHSPKTVWKPIPNRWDYNFWNLLVSKRQVSPKDEIHSSIKLGVMTKRNTTQEILSWAVTKQKTVHERVSSLLGFGKRRVTMLRGKYFPASRRMLSNTLTAS